MEYYKLIISYQNTTYGVINNPFIKLFQKFESKKITIAYRDLARLPACQTICTVITDEGFPQFCF
jgi:hypothetical protein